MHRTACVVQINTVIGAHTVGRQPAVHVVIIGIDPEGFLLVSVSLPLPCSAALPHVHGGG